MPGLDLESPWSPWKALLLDLESHVRCLGAILKQNIEDFVEIWKTYRNLRKTCVFTWFGGAGGRLFETIWPSCGPLGPILDDIDPS